MYQATVTQPQDRTRVAVLGCGYWGMNYIRILQELSEADAAIVCDERTSRLDEVARRYPNLPLTDNIEEALATEGVQAAIVCTQATTHREIAGAALDAGKHVLIEKPLATRLTHADELIALAAAHRRVLLVGHTFVYNPGVQKIKSLLDNCELGDIYYLYARRTSLGPIRWDVNAIWDLAPHDVAIFNYLLDQTPEWVSAVGGCVLGGMREDVGFISLGYSNNVISHIHVSWADPHKVREFSIVGSDARVSFNDLDLVERVRIFEKGVKFTDEPTNFGEFHMQVRDGDITSPSLPIMEPLKEVVEHFLHCLRCGEQPLTDGFQGREVVAVMQAIEESSRKHGAPVLVDNAASTRRESNVESAVS
jgi:predicted dehydrogenase